MKKRLLLVLTVLVQTVFSNAQTDSLLTMSDLSFHNAFERKAYTNFVQHDTDTLSAFLAVDDLLGEEDFLFLKKKYENLWNELSSKKIEKKKVNAQINLVYSTVKNNFLKTYIQGEYVSSTLLSGRYNEVTASILMGLIFDRLHIPYQLLDSNLEFSFMVNPGAKEQKLDVGPPIHLSVEPSPEYLKAYMEYLRKASVLTELDLRTYTYQELYNRETKKQNPITMKELLGLYYYFQSGKEVGLGDLNGGLELIQKSVYLYQTPYIMMHYRNCLAQKMDQLVVKNATDIDHLLRLRRVGYLDMETTSAIFRGLISNQLEFDNKASLCDSMYERFTSKINDQELLDELAFSYHLMRVNQTNPTYTDIFRVDKAASIKPNIKTVNDYMEGILHINLYKFASLKTRLDSIETLSKQLKSPAALDAVHRLHLTFLLDLAVDGYKNKKTKEGEKYLLAFENACPAPIGNERLRTDVERSYREMAVAAYWSGNMNYAANQKMVQRGLKMVPDSEVIKSGTYEKNTVKYVNTNPEVKYLKKDEKEKPKTGRTIRVISKDKKEKVYSL